MLLFIFCEYYVKQGLHNVWGKTDLWVAPAFQCLGRKSSGIPFCSVACHTGDSIHSPLTAYPVQCGNDRCEAPIILSAYQTKPQLTNRRTHITYSTELPLAYPTEHTQMLTCMANTSSFLCFPHDSCSMTFTINCLLLLPHPPDYSHTSYPLTFNTEN